MPLEGAMEYCQYGSVILFTTNDSKEGTKAFLDKRKAEFRGK
jgi:1,4-dihydroxy-2-naphthoyl-CoA synthase